MLSDRYGFLLSTPSAPARDAYVAACDALFAADPLAQSRFRLAIEQDPAFALAIAGLARAEFILARVPQARELAAAARIAAERATLRERSHVNALCLSIEGKGVEALAATREHLVEWPRDAMVLAPATSVFGLIGFSGRQGREPEQLALLEPLEPLLGGDWWFDAVHAFALEECGQLERARALIERSLSINPRNAHAAHILAHVLYEQGEDGASLAFLERWMSDYPREGMMHCHLSWHVAMAALAIGDYERAWSVYQAQVHPGASWGPPINTLTDSAAFLWRAELAGAPRRADHWRELGRYADERFAAPGLAFVDTHLALTRAATGGDVAGLVAVLRQRDAEGKSPAGGVVEHLAEGFAAFERVDDEAAITALTAALPQTVRIGGSRAQRDLAVNTLLAVYLRTGRHADARALIAQREDRQPAVPVAGWAALATPA